MLVLLPTWNRLVGRAVKEKNFVVKRQILSRAGWLVAGVLASLSAVGQTQAWEKIVAPGLTYRMEIDLSLPRVVHALRYTPGDYTIAARPEIAKDTVFIPEEAAKGRDLLSKTISRKGAIAGVNGDFFPWTGDPIGTMVRFGELVSAPFPGRSAFAWGDGYSYVGPIDEAMTAAWGQTWMGIDVLNAEVGDNQVGLTTATGGTVSCKSKGVQVVLDLKDKLAPSGSWEGKVNLVVPDRSSYPVAAGQMVLSGTGSKAAALSQLKPGDSVTITTDSKSVDWAKAVHAIGGGPMLVKDGKAAIDLKGEQFSADFSTTRHPRTAVGVTAKGDLLLVVVDGRQPMSRGASLDELAQLMIRLGCVKALNLDGGGSSTMNVLGQTLNRPSGGEERMVADSLLLFGKVEVTNADSTYVIKGSPKLSAGSSATYSVVGPDGKTVPSGDVFWSAMGAAWVDQAGVLRGLEKGTCTLTARIGGVLTSVEVTVDPKG